MDLSSNQDIIKEEVNVYYEVCEKEEPNLFFREPDIPVSLNNNTDGRIRVILDSSDEEDNFNQLNIKADILNVKREDCSQQSFFTIDIGSSNLFESDQIVLKKEENFERCGYFVDSKDVGNLSGLEKVDIKSYLEISDSNPFVGLEQLLEKSNNNFRNEEILFCSSCKFSTVFRGNLIRHIKRKHFSIAEVKKFNCSICDYKCVFKSELVRHALKHEDKFIYYCHFCSYGVNKRCRVVQHTYQKHNLETFDETFENNKKCYVCKYKTNVKSEFLSHFFRAHKQTFNTVTTRKTKIVYKGHFPCELCSYVSSSNHTLLVHIDAVHKKIRPYACDQCNYEANRFSDLRIHKAAKHEKLTPFKCELCGYASAYKKHLRRHVSSQHVNKKRGKYARKTVASNIKIEVDELEIISSSYLSDTKFLL